MNLNLLLSAESTLAALTTIPASARTPEINALIDECNDALGSVLRSVYHDHKHGGSTHYYRVPEGLGYPEMKDLLVETYPQTFELEDDQEWIHTEDFAAPTDLRPEPAAETSSPPASTPLDRPLDSIEPTEPALKVRLTIDVTYDLSETTLERAEAEDDAHRMLEQLVERAYGDGLFTGGSDLLVESYQHDITTL